MSPPGGDTGDAGAIAPVDDAVAGVALAALASAALVWFIPAYTDASAGEYDVSPAFFPKLAVTIILVLSVGLALMGFARMRGPSSATGSTGASALLEFAAWNAVAAPAMLGIAQVGFVATAAVLIAAGMLLAGRRTWLLIAITAVAFPLLLDRAAWWIFTVNMP